MAPAAADQSPSQLFACRCLNVRLTVAPTESPPPDSSTDAPYCKIHVGDDGIQVKHPQLTLRVKSRRVSIPGTAKSSRFTTLTCLACNLAVYRIHQTFSSAVEAKDLPLLPSDDWAEQEIMKSPNGWVEVNQACLTGDAIARAQSLPDYSQLYSLILPPASNQVPTSPQTWVSPDSESTTSATPTAAVTSYLNHLPPLFPPPPFTPSHPTFLHLVAFAQKESEILRQSADEELAKIVKARTAEVQANEANLKAQVERLWLKYRDSLEKIQQDKPQAHLSSNPWPSTTRTNDFRNNVQKAPVSIRDFVPVSVTAPVRSTPPPVRQSALSASRTPDSVLHQVMADKGVRDSGSGASDSTSTINTGSSTLVPNSTSGREITSVRQFKRNIDDSINTAASFRYFLLEDEMARRRKSQNQNQGDGTERDETMGLCSAPAPPVKGSDNEPISNAGNGTDAKEGKDKHKKDSKNKNKHVHFNVQPPAEESSTKKRTEKANRPDTEEMVFRLDDNNEGDEDISPIKASLPLLEQPVIPPRARRIRFQPTTGLPASFSALRPTSLPAPSHMRAGRTSGDVYSNNIMSSLPRPSELVSKAVNGDNKHKDTNDQDTSEDTTDSSPRPTSESESDSEDYDYESRYNARCGIPGSLPINIVSAIRPREVLSLASYQPKSTVSTAQQQASPTTEAEHPKQMSAAAIRRAAHAARDRTKLLDPGHLDFVAEEDEDEDEALNGGKFVAQSMESGERARQHALKILQARAELPEEGMWRSLA